MRTIFSAVGSRISHKIILPYLVLVLCVVLAITFVAVRLTVGALQERLDNRLLEAGQVTSDELAAIEHEHLGQLRAMAFTEGVGSALRSGDSRSLEVLLRPHWANAGLATLIAFDSSGRPLLSWQRPVGAGADEPPHPRPVADLHEWPFVQQLVREQNDELGDKFSAIHANYLYTAAPVRDNGQLAGGLIVGLPLEAVLKRLGDQSQASATLLYDAEGRVLAAAPARASGAAPQAMPLAVLEQLRTPRAQRGEAHVGSVAANEGRPYQYAFNVLELRDRPAGFFAVAFPRQFIVDTWANERVPLVIAAVALVVLTVGLGLGVARRITRPLEDLALAAQSVARGELTRRSSTASRDEVAVVAGAFNQMTERLVQLYDASRKLNAHIEIPAIMVEVEGVIAAIVPGTTVVAVLEGAGGRTVRGAAQAEALLRSSTVGSALATAEFPHTDQPVVCAIHAGAWNAALTPLGYVEACSLALQVQGMTIGWLVLLFDRVGLCTAAVHAPLIAIASMLASALQKAQLYEQVRHEARRRRVILESIADGVLVLNRDRKVVLMNRAAESLFNAADWAPACTHFDELPLIRLDEGSSRLAATGQIQMRYTCRGRVFSASSAALADDTGALDGEVIVLHDISSEVALSHAKTSLITMVAQELRSPLAGVQGTFDLLRKGVGGELSPLYNELAESALQQCRAMGAVVDRAQLLAELEMGVVYAETLPINVNDLLHGLVVEWLPAASAAGIVIKLDVPGDLPPARSDGLLLSLALRQLAEDAIAHSVGTTVLVAAGSDQHHVWIELRDCGASLTRVESTTGQPGDLPARYDASRRGESIGHVISQHIVTRLGGELELRQPPDGGHAARLVLPVAPVTVPELVA